MQEGRDAGMTDTAPQSVLRRKARAGAALPGGAAMTPAKALRQALAKTSQDLMAMPVDIVGMQDLRLSLAEIPEQIEERALLMVLAGPEEGLGLMVLSPATVATLIEMQTTGRIGAAPVAPRRPTRTDAAMSMRFVNQILAEMELLLATSQAIIWAGGFRYSSYLDDPRPLGLLLEDVGYRGFRVSVRFGNDGVREGQILLVLPTDGRGPAPERGRDHERDDAANRPGLAGADWAVRIEEAVLGVRTEVEAVLDRLTLPLADILTLKPGATLSLPPQALSHVRIEGHGGRFVAHARLGQCQGKMAVRVFMGPIEEDEAVVPLLADLAVDAGPSRGGKPAMLPDAVDH